MSVYSRATSVAAYKSVATHSAVLEADPYQLICMLMDGALERLHIAKGCIERGDKTQKASVLHRVGAIIDELRSSLDHKAGGKIATDLDALYDYMMRRVMSANLQEDVAAIDEVGRLLSQIRAAWGQIPPQARVKAP